MRTVTKKRDVPPAWFRDDVGELMESGFPTRYREDCWDAIGDVAAKYQVTRTMAIRILVQRSLRELGAL